MVRCPGDGRVEEAAQRLRETDPLRDSVSTIALAQEQVLGSRGLGVVAFLLEDPAISEIMINGPGPVWIDTGSLPEPSGFVVGPDELALLIERIVDPLGLQLDRSTPLVDARLDDGSRVHIVVPPLAVDGPVVTIRRFVERPLPLEAFGGHQVVEMLESLIHDRRTVLVVGATSTGKTSLLNALGALLDPRERIVTIEDTAELRLPGRHVVRLEARPSNREGVGEVTLQTLVRNALRMRPDRLVVGEVRGPEALDLLFALSSGHDGSLATCHADSPTAALRRLEVLSLLGGTQLSGGAVRALLASSIDVIVCLARRGPRRLVTEVALVPDDPVEPVRTFWADRRRPIAS